MRRQTLLAVAITAALTSTTGAVAASKITGAQIKDGTITGRDIKADSIGVGDLSPSAARFLAGDTGDTGPTGPAGAQGPPGITSLQRVAGVPGNQGATGSGATVAASTATCPPGTYVTGGGYATASIQNDVGASWAPNAYQWAVVAVNYYAQPNSITAYAVCASGPTAAAATRRPTGTPASVHRRVAQMQADVDAG